MSKYKRKRYIEGPSVRGQRAARRIAATNKIRPRTVTRTNETPSPAATGGEIFATGAMLELIRDAANDEIKLIRSDGPNVSISARFVVDGKVFVPPALDDDVMKAINLPSNAADYVSTTALFDDLRVCSKSIVGCRRNAFRKPLLVRWRLGSQNARRRFYSSRLPMLPDPGCCWSSCGARVDVP
jgi:hypothetical protein